MFATRQHLNRRTFLRGAGAAVALPLLDAMVPAHTAWAQTAARPVERFGFVYVPHGTIMDQWMPAQAGADFEFSTILKPLEPFREYVNVITGLTNEGENGHSPSPGMWMSGAFPAKGSTVLLNRTADQVIAEHIGQETTFPSLEVATEDMSSSLGSCAGDFLCSYMSTISWRTPTQPLPMEINPRVVFERMFGGDAATDEARLARLEQSTSILDGVAESARALRRDLGAPDRAKLDEYLENVREIERRLVQGERQRSESSLEVPAPPTGIPESFEEHIVLMFELQALALQADLTRVTSFMLSRSLSTQSYPQIGVAECHHPISHNNYVPEVVEKKARVDTYHAQLFANFLERLRSTPDGEGSILDHSTFLYGSGMSNSNVHDHINLPTLVVGGLFPGNRHIKLGELAPDRDASYVPKYTETVPFANLLVTILNRAGVETDAFGLERVASDGHIAL